MAAAALLIVVRPRLRRPAGEWGTILLFGASMALMNGLLGLAIQRIPFGLAITIDFLGPCAVALVVARRRLLAAPLLALLGVALIGGPGGAEPLGVLCGAGSAAAFACYTLLAGRLGGPGGGVDGLALVVAAAAVLTTPWSVPAVEGLRGEDLLPLGAAALLGVVVAYGLDLAAVRAAGVATVAVFFVLDPALAVLLGAALLEQVPAPLALAGVAVVVLAGGATILASTPRGAPAVSPG